MVKTFACTGDARFDPEQGTHNLPGTSISKIPAGGSSDDALSCWSMGTSVYAGQVKDPTHG